MALSRRGGTIVEIGIPDPSVGVAVPLVQIPLTGKRIIGCVYGGSSVFRDMAALRRLAEAGRMDLDHPARPAHRASPRSRPRSGDRSAPDAR